MYDISIQRWYFKSRWILFSTLQETQGVCVCTFGDTDDFPAFYTVKSGFKAPYRVQNAQDAAKIIYAAYAYQLSSGTVIAVPIPKEYALDG